MAGFNASGDDDVLSSINVTPLVDVVLVLLIIFIVTASAIVKAAIEVDLPKASNTDTITKPPLSIIVGCVEKQGETTSKGCTPGKIIVDGEELVDLQAPDASIDPLLLVIRREVAEADAQEGEDKGLNVLITADKDLKFQSVIWLMDVLKNEGAAGIMFNSEHFTSPEDPRQLPSQS